MILAMPVCIDQMVDGGKINSQSKLVGMPEIDIHKR